MSAETDYATGSRRRPHRIAPEPRAGRANPRLGLILLAIAMLDFSLAVAQWHEGKTAMTFALVVIGTACAVRSWDNFSATGRRP